jgi:hypothetical protein
MTDWRTEAGLGKHIGPNTPMPDVTSECSVKRQDTPDSTAQLGNRRVEGYTIHLTGGTDIRVPPCPICQACPLEIINQTVWSGDADRPSLTGITYRCSCGQSWIVVMQLTGERPFA